MTHVHTMAGGEVNIRGVEVRVVVKVVVGVMIITVVVACDSRCRWLWLSYVAIMKVLQALWNLGC